MERQIYPTEKREKNSSSNILFSILFFWPENRNHTNSKKANERKKIKTQLNFLLPFFPFDPSLTSLSRTHMPASSQGRHTDLCNCQETFSEHQGPEHFYSWWTHPTFYQILKHSHILQSLPDLIIATFWRTYWKTQSEHFISI